MLKPSDENIELLRSAKERKKYIPYFEDHKKVFQNIAVDAVRKALVKKAKKLNDCDRPLQKQQVIIQLSQIRTEQFKNKQELKSYKIDMVHISLMQLEQIGEFQGMFQ